MKRLVLGLGMSLAAALTVGCQTVPQEEVARGQYYFNNYCLPCHGADGGGNPEIAAPAITGLQAWYVESQLHSFRTGMRGSHFDDLEGMRMRPMSRTLANEADVKAVAEYVAKMPKVAGDHTVEGDATKGQTEFAACMACHGLKGEGNEAMKAPPLAGQDGWYLLTQLKKFKEGVRGYDPKDVNGQTMARQGTATLENEQEMKDVVAHIQTLKTE